ncbi:MAG: hypothetical protein QG622_2312 [Actinomycetota bacterium]|nr:hypothetical protein [Actinomycetota bacterium]
MCSDGVDPVEGRCRYTTPIPQRINTITTHFRIRSTTPDGVSTRCLTPPQRANLSRRSSRSGIRADSALGGQADRWAAKWACARDAGVKVITALMVPDRSWRPGSPCRPIIANLGDDDELSPVTVDGVAELRFMIMRFGTWGEAMIKGPGPRPLTRIMPLMLIPGDRPAIPPSRIQCVQLLSLSRQ